MYCSRLCLLEFCLKEYLIFPLVMLGEPKLKMLI